MIAEITLVLKDHAAIDYGTHQYDSIMEEWPDVNEVKKKGKRALSFVSLAASTHCLPFLYFLS